MSRYHYVACASPMGLWIYSILFVQPKYGWTKVERTNTISELQYSLSSTGYTS
jgi:hypothetical protein